MERYPFDIQKCRGIIEPNSKESLYVQLVGESLAYEGPTVINQYSVISFTLVEGVRFSSFYEPFYKSFLFQDQLQFELTFGRQLLSEFLTAVLPTILIVLVTK